MQYFIRTAAHQPPESLCITLERKPSHYVGQSTSRWKESFHAGKGGIMFHFVELWQRVQRNCSAPLKLQSGLWKLEWLLQFTAGTNDSDAVMG